MDAFVTRKRRRLSPTPAPGPPTAATKQPQAAAADQESTDVKLAILLSLFPDVEQHDLLDILVSYDGSVEAATAALSAASAQQRKTKKRLASSSSSSSLTTTSSTPRIQSSLSSYAIKIKHIPGTAEEGQPKPLSSMVPPIIKPLTKKGKTLHLFSPQDISTHTPCTIIHNFLPTDEANSLLSELLEESTTFTRHTFQLFENTVQSPHSSAFYVSDGEAQRQQTSEYVYNGTYRKNVRQLTPRMRTVSAKVQEAVNAEVARRIRERYPGGKKLRYQSPKEWVPNAAVVNCYDGPAESVGYHSDELTYLGPRAIIGSLSLGVEREFRVRRIVARDDDEYYCGDEQHNDNHNKHKNNACADAEGQISIHLPHNSLLVMHAEMQEEWKHCIAPAQTISPHPIAGNRRINITYRWYRESLHPRYTPKCRCGVPAVLRCVQRKRETRGRYMWMCYAGYAPGGKGCPFFQWAEFDDDGEPIRRTTRGGQ
ncbi:hypothetical protein VTN00DRAFT_9421 [Thermoascus crustaceus]|uniref:uncharacterized protein n=1 Tax=Thermoascus crustaceus TaxID=5088 RepID=UPI0037437148